MLNYGSETDFSVLNAISSDELLRESSSVKNLCKCWDCAPFLWLAALTATPLRVVTAQVPGQERLATVHLAMSDASGDSAIVEYIDGEQVIHHGRQY